MEGESWSDGAMESESWSNGVMEGESWSLVDYSVFPTKD